MIPKEKIQKKRAVQKSSILPFTTGNYILFIIGLLFIVIGYIALSKGPWDSVWSLTVAPIFLVLAYCILIPVAILYHKKDEK
jgi:uncharacterized membrane protein HdeD (DUF308 family)